MTHIIAQKHYLLLFSRLRGNFNIFALKTQQNNNNYMQIWPRILVILSNIVMNELMAYEEIE